MNTNYNHRDYDDDDDDIIIIITVIIILMINIAATHELPKEGK